MNIIERTTAPALMRDERGNILVLVALLLPLLLGFAALAVDAGHLYVTHTKLQGAADAAALAAVQELPDGDAARAAAVEYAVKNLPAEIYGDAVTESDVEVGQWDAASRSFVADASPPNAVRVTVQRSQARGNAVVLAFSDFVGYADADVVTSATAGPPMEPVCTLALEPTEKHAWLLGGSVSVDAPDCHVYINSSYPNDAADPKGTGTVVTKSIKAVGYGHGHLELVTPPLEQVDDPIPDPLDGLSLPAYAGCDHDGLQIDTDTVILSPGVYCEGLEIMDSTVTLEAGLYIITGDIFRVEDSSVQGDHVTIYLADGDATIDWKNSVVDLSGQATGDLAGIVLLGRPDDDVQHTIQTTDFNLEGVVYLPNGGLEFVNTGTVNEDAAFTSFIAREFIFDGDGTVTINFNPDATDVPVLPAVLAAVPGEGIRLLD